MKEEQPKRLGERIGETTRILGAVGVPVGFFFSPEVFSIGVILIVLGEGARRLSAGKKTNG